MPSMVHEHSKNISPTRILMIVIGLIAVLAIGAIVYIGQLDVINISETTYHLKSQDKITLISLCVLLSLVFTIIIIFLKRKINEQEAKTFSTWILCVVLVELVVTLCLTPLWLDMMYHIPWTISFCIRVVKECAVLPIEIFIGYSLIPLLRRIWIRLER
ncbi:folate family ECF transporter S component [Allocoprobacillus halotolerans]|uniref:Folate family ECF transporter S component n=1 Tax=Allocoprobacillus halotolerans TaxID=2944914 RepID=A0ABY5I6B6_9FIRM|nr:folate family ECF transporter S component [Allocoprobacillus halotolerans]UTY40901.1 folate family ECF transporter S component [Allocoprobacillus halotolerans]